MTHKSFYEAAAAEVAAGHLDNALWIKVNAEMADADNGARQARYITLRAQEMAGESTKQQVTGLWHRVPRWVIAVVVLFILIWFVIPALYLHY